jgi:patatin-like phospholipase/acyl hydrolase
MSDTENAKNPYSILSLDGGGTWALIQARILQERYPEMTGHEILRQYDMVIANSGGSLVLAALCEDMTAKYIRRLFEDTNILKSIFQRNFWHIPFVNRFSTIQKKKGLTSALKKFAHTELKDLPRFIGKSSLQIIITGFDYDSTRAVYFRSNCNWSCYLCEDKRVRY